MWTTATVAVPAIEPLEKKNYDSFEIRGKEILEFRNCYKTFGQHFILLVRSNSYQFSHVCRLK